MGVDDEDDDKTESDDAQDVPEVADGTDTMGPLDTMTKEGMNKTFGREALFMLGAMFQHTSKICEEVQFLDPKSLIQLVMENGKKTSFRKRQGFIPA